MVSPSATDTMQTSFPDPLPPAEALPQKLRNAEIIDWTRAFRNKHNRNPKWPEVKANFPDASKSTAWRRVKAA